MSRGPRFRVPVRAQAAQQLAFSHPAAAAVGRSNIASLVRTMKVQIWVKAYGEDATRCLANLCLLLGLGAEAELAVNGLTPELRVLHGALRTVHGWCMSGYTWQIQDPAGIERALDLAHSIVLKHPQSAMAAAPNAMYLSDRVMAKQVTASDVAGAEIYAQSQQGQVLGATA